MCFYLNIELPKGKLLETHTKLGYGGWTGASDDTVSKINELISKITKEASFKSSLAGITKKINSHASKKSKNEAINTYLAFYKKKIVESSGENNSELFRITEALEEMLLNKK